MTGRYDRQESLDIIQDQRVSVVGVGGVGSWVAYALGLAGVRELHLFDEDLVAVHNLNRLPVPASALGKAKSEAMADVLFAAGADIIVHAHSHLVPELHEQIIGGSNWVVCCTDSLKSRRMVYELCKKVGAYYIECGADGDRATVSFSPAEWSTPDEENPGYQSVPVHVGPCMLAASIAAYYVLHRSGPPDSEPLHQVDWEDAYGQLKLYDISELTRR